jgi:hypothetical protein
MNDSDFEQLLASVREAGRIRRGEQEPSDKFEVKPEGKDQYSSLKGERRLFPERPRPSPARD